MPDNTSHKSTLSQKHAKIYLENNQKQKLKILLVKNHSRVCLSRAVNNISYVRTKKSFLI